MIVLLVLHLFLVNLPTLRGQTYVEGKLNRYVLQRFFFSSLFGKKKCSNVVVVQTIEQIESRVSEESDKIFVGLLSKEHLIIENECVEMHFVVQYSMSIISSFVQIDDKTV